MARSRLDQLLVARGLAQSRERARALLMAGNVTVGGRVITKAGTLVDPDADVVLKQADHPWVGRGGLKLAHALETFRIDVSGALALDIGASTGGFTDVLLQRGARRVVALDVGHNQIDWRLRTDPRVVVLEGVNARYLKPDGLPEDARVFDIVTIDVSFIALAHILPVVPPLLAPIRSRDRARQTAVRGRTPRCWRRRHRHRSGRARPRHGRRDARCPSGRINAPGRCALTGRGRRRQPGVSAASHTHDMTGASPSGPRVRRASLIARHTLPAALDALREAAAHLELRGAAPVIESTTAEAAGTRRPVAGRVTRQSGG